MPAPRKPSKRSTRSTAVSRIAGVGDPAVREATGKSWSQWFKILDDIDATRLPHPDIARYLHTRQKLSGWWSQMITVGYEQARGLRRKHEKPAGFEISRSRTIAAGVSAVFQAWQDGATRRRWLSDPAITIHKATRNKTMRITWIDGERSVNVHFLSKGRGKCQVVVQHGKLGSAQEAERRKVYWAAQLDRLQDLLEARKS